MSLHSLQRYQMRRAQTVDQLCELVHEEVSCGGAVVLLAGGTDFFVNVAKQPPSTRPLPLVIDVSAMKRLVGISRDGQQMVIGAATTYRQLQEHADVREYAPLLHRMSYDIGGPTIQSRGTLGGNLATASPAADGVAVLAAYNATLVLLSVRGQRRIPFSAMQTGYKTSVRRPDEIILAIELSLTKKNSPWMWRKIGGRAAQAISKVALAGIAEVANDRICRFGLALASVAPVTATMPKTHRLAMSRTISDLRRNEIEAAVQSDICPIDDLRSTKAYRLHCAKRLTLAFFRQLGAAL